MRERFLRKVALRGKNSRIMHMTENQGSKRRGQTRLSSWTAVAVTPLSKDEGVRGFQSGVALRLPPHSKTLTRKSTSLLSSA
jgi:hypothetical protein